MKLMVNHNFYFFLRIIFITTIPLLFGCNANNSSHTIDALQALHRFNHSVQLVSKSKELLNDGDIILRTGNDVISSLFAQLNKQDKTYSHCGIAFKEKGEWVVYHSIGGEDNPDAKLRRDTYEKFVSRSHNLGFAICRYPSNNKQIEKLKFTVDSFYQKQIPFDMQFDLKSNDRMYCAEMVYKSFNRAFETTHFFTTSIHQGFEYVSTDNIFVNNNARILCHVVY